MPGISKGKVYKYDKQGIFVAEYESCQQAADLNQVNENYLSKHIEGKFSFCKNNIYTKKYYLKLPDELLIHKSKRIYKTCKIYQYDKEGNFLNEYENKDEAAKKTNLKARYIRDFASGNSGRGKTYGGFLWSYKKENKIPKFEKKHRHRKIHQYSRKGDYITSYDSIKEAAIKNNQTMSGIIHCAQGHKKFQTSGGYIWRYEKLNKVKEVKQRKRPIVVYFNNKKYKQFESVAETYKQLDIPLTRIYECLKGKIKKYKGYSIKYLNN